MNNTDAAAIIEPFYDLFRADKRNWEKGMDVLTDDWKSYYTNAAFRTKEETRPYIGGLFDLVPDMNVEIIDVNVAGEIIAVRSELSGTPKGDFMVPHSGHSFSIMTIDLHLVRDGRLAVLYHLEDWGTAIKQLSGQDEARTAATAARGGGSA